MEIISETYRLFIAIPVPEPVKAELLRVQEELRSALPQGSVRWTKPEQFHLTLRFLGKVEAQQMEALSHSLREACRAFRVLSLRAERIGFFPDLRYPRVVWGWVHDVNEQLPIVQSAIEQAVSSFTTERAEKNFTGHITLGRCQGIKRAQAGILSQLALAMNDRFFGEWLADKVELFRSEALSQGTRYTTLAAIALGT